MVVVMRSRKAVYLTVVAAVIAAAWFLYACGSRPSAVPAVGIAPVGFTSPGELPEGSLGALIKLTIAGSAGATYWVVGNQWAHARTAAGWTDCSMLPDARQNIMLCPCSNMAFCIWLPKGTLEWQCGLSVRTPSIRQRAMLNLVHSAYYRRFRWLVPLLSSHMGQKVKVQSEMFEINGDSGKGSVLEM
jgi:hypothetical protein